MPYFFGNLVDGKELFGIIYYEAAHPLAHGKINVLVGLVVRMKICLREVEAGKRCGVYFSTGNHVDAQSLLGYYLI